MYCQTSNIPLVSVPPRREMCEGQTKDVAKRAYIDIRVLNPGALGAGNVKRSFKGHGYLTETSRPYL